MQRQRTAVDSFLMREEIEEAALDSAMGALNREIVSVLKSSAQAMMQQQQARRRMLKKAPKRIWA